MINKITLSLFRKNTATVRVSLYFLIQFFKIGSYMSNTTGTYVVIYLITLPIVAALKFISSLLDNALDPIGFVVVMKSSIMVCKISNSLSHNMFFTPVSTLL